MDIIRIKTPKLWFFSSAYKSLGNSRKASCVSWNKRKNKCCGERLINVRAVKSHNHRVEFLIALPPSPVAWKLNAEVCFRRTTTQREYIWETKWMFCNVFKFIPPMKQSWKSHDLAPTSDTMPGDTVAFLKLPSRRAEPPQVPRCWPSTLSVPLTVRPWDQAEQPSRDRSSAAVSPNKRILAQETALSKDIF